MLSADEVALAARTIRALTVDAVARAGSGHVGLPLGCAEIGVVLFGEVLRHDPDDPDWPDRDRFVLSAGHGSMLLYSLLHLSGYSLPLDEIERFRQLHSRTPGHPERQLREVRADGERKLQPLTPGVETTTGPLGQGLGNAVGMALAERLLAAQLQSDLVDHRTYVLASDGDLMEGVGSEAASLAGHLGLGRLIVLYDDNRVTIDGPTSLTFSENVAQRFEAYDWEVQTIDGHDPGAIREALARAADSESRPHLIACRTQIGRSSPVAGEHTAHGAISLEQMEQTRESLGWTLPPYEVPEAARRVFRANAARGRRLHAQWLERWRRVMRDREGEREPDHRAQLWRELYERKLPDGLANELPAMFKPGSEAPASAMATRRASGRILNALAPRVRSLVGGSADLAGSNETTLRSEAPIERGKLEGRNVHYGVREHAMAAAASGMALHGGLRPYVGTFLVFSDYMRPSLRLAAIMRLPVVYVFSHDSIFVGEDGPTHQPVEHFAALRAIPGLELWRPADARETAAAWLNTLERDSGPVALALTRQSLPVLDSPDVDAGARRGGYVLVPERDPAGLELAIVGSGSETHCARAAARTLNAEGRSVRCVSIPSLDVFLAQDDAYRSEVLPASAPRLVVEAGVSLGVAPLLRPGDRFHGMEGFGASAPYRELGRHFGFTDERVTELARELLGSSRSG